MRLASCISAPARASGRRRDRLRSLTRAIAGAAIFILLCAGCGYADDNPRAAALVAQAYLDAFASRDAAAVCRLVAPEVKGALAAGQACEDGVRPQFKAAASRLVVGRVREIPAPAVNPRFAVEVSGQPGRFVTVGRYGSIWRVVDGGVRPEAAEKPPLGGG